jgi:hypothetical protein
VETLRCERINHGIALQTKIGGLAQGLLGHENRRTTEIYLHSHGQNDRDAMKMLGEAVAGAEAEVRSCHEHDLLGQALGPYGVAFTMTRHSGSHDDETLLESPCERIYQPGCRLKR